MSLGSAQCTSIMASPPGVDGGRGRSGVAGSTMGTSALSWEVWTSWNSFHFLPCFFPTDDCLLSPGDLRNLRSCPGLQNSFSMTYQMEMLILWPGLYLLLPTAFSYPSGHSPSPAMGFSLHTRHLRPRKRWVQLSTCSQSSRACRRSAPMSSLNSKVSGQPPSHWGLDWRQCWSLISPCTNRMGMGHGPGLARMLPIDHGVSEEFLDLYLEGSRCRRGKHGSPTTRATRGCAVEAEDGRKKMHSLARWCRRRPHQTTSTNIPTAGLRPPVPYRSRALCPATEYLLSNELLTTDGVERVRVGYECPRGGPSLAKRLHKVKAWTINNNPHLDRLPAIHNQTYNLCRLTSKKTKACTPKSYNMQSSQR